MNLEFIKPQNLGSLLMKSSQSNLNLWLPGSYLVCSHSITTVLILTGPDFVKTNLCAESKNDELSNSPNMAQSRRVIKLDLAAMSQLLAFDEVRKIFAKFWFNLQENNDK